MSKMKVLTSLSCIIIATSPVLARPIASEFSLSKRLAQLWRPIYEMNGRPVVPADDAIFTDYHIEIRSTSAPGDSSTSFPTITASSGDPPFASGTGSGTGFGTGTGSPPTTTDVTITLTSTVTEVATSQETASSTQVSSSQPATSSTESFAPTPSNNGFLNGVNIGNWLILEKWMDKGTTFKDQFANAQDQWTFDSIEGSAEALEKHWSTWFTQADVQKIKSWGFNTLRIPIGYWAYDDPATSGVPYKPGADAYLEKAIGWAREAGMKVMVDCHGSPGSQNGQDHSGHSGPVEWQQGNNLQKSIDLLTVMAKKYGSQEYADVVFGLEIVNEPKADGNNNFETSKQWAAKAYTALQSVITNKNLVIITHDSFMGPKNFIPIAQQLGTSTTFGVDQHNYQLYTDADNVKDQKQHIASACDWAKDLAETKAAMPVYVGEWSALTNVCVNPDGSTFASKDCGSAQSSVSDPSGWSKQTVEVVRRYIEAQLDVFERNTQGQFIWSYGGPGGWGVENLIQAGAYPKNGERLYPGQCSS